MTPISVAFTGCCSNQQPLLISHVASQITHINWQPIVQQTNKLTTNITTKTTDQVGRIHRLLAEPSVCERLGQCVEAVGKQVDTINLDRWDNCPTRWCARSLVDAFVCLHAYILWICLFYVCSLLGSNNYHVTEHAHIARNLCSLFVGGVEKVFHQIFLRVQIRRGDYLFWCLFMFAFRYDGGIDQEQFLKHFKDILEENQANKSWTFSVFNF